jgi:hypothetical protein
VGLQFYVFFQGQQQTGQHQTKGKLLDENAKVQTTPNKLNSLIKEQTQLFVPPVVKDGFLVSKIGEMQLLILKILDGFPQLITQTHRACTTLKILQIQILKQTMATKNRRLCRDLNLDLQDRKRLCCQLSYVTPL